MFKKGDLYISYSDETYMTRKGKTRRSQSFSMDIFNEKSFFYADIDKKTASDAFSDYIPDFCSHAEV